MFRDSEIILEKNVYKTSENKKRVFFDRLFLGTRFYFVWKCVKVALDMSNRAKNGKYNYNEYIEHSMIALNLIEDLGGKVEVEGIENLKKVNLIIL